MYDLGSRLKEMRNRRGLTQKELAERINKSVSAISGYESNVQTPPTDVLVSISHVLHVPLTYFVDLSCEDTYFAQGLTNAQKEILNLLFAEFSAPSNIDENLSARQIDIIRKIILLFSK